MITIKSRVITVAALLAVVAGVVPAYASDVWSFLGNHEVDSFKIIHVADLSALIAKGDVTILDANPPDVRAQEGVIPGARLLPSSSGYDVATTLPAAKNAKLVFYCHNTH
ncbi:MAG: rhodanese-like domain-containing protein [Candidatus Binataceae bacterium]|jgi:hypothetical protein